MVHMLTQDSKLHPEDPKKFMGYGIGPIYVGIHLVCISRKICKCVEGWSVPLSILSQSHAATHAGSHSLKYRPLHLQIFHKTQERCMPMYMGPIPCPMNFFGSSGCNLESWASICTGNTQFTTLAIVWQLYLTMGSLCIFLRHSEYIYNSIPKNSESILRIYKNTKIEFSFYVQIQTHWAP